MNILPRIKLAGLFLEIKHPNMIIPKPGKSKEMLMKSLNALKVDFAKEIGDNDVRIEDTTDGFRLKAEKTILFMKFWVNAEIRVLDGAYEILWETNAPAGKVNEAIEKVRKVLEEVK